MNTYRRYTIVLLLLSLIAGSFILRPMFTASASGQDKQQSVRISDAAARQIQSLIAEKASRTPEQNKIDSQLLYSLKMSRNERLAEGVESLKTGLSTDTKDLVQVDIRSTDSKPVLEKLKALGAEIVNSFERSVRARLPLGDIEQLTNMPEVTFIMPGDDAVTSAEIRPNPSVRPTPQMGLPTRLPRHCSCYNAIDS